MLINFFCKQKKSAKNISLELKIACVLTRTSLYHRLRSHVCDYVALPFLLFPRHLFSHGRRKILSYFCTNVFLRSVRGRTCRACTTTQKQQLLIYVTRSAACFIFFATFFGCKARYFYFLSLLACGIDLTRRYIFWSSILQGEFWLKAADRKQRLVASSKKWLSNSRMYQLIRVPVDRVDKQLPNNNNPYNYKWEETIHLTHKSG